jgi:hypothetical protein
VNRRRGRRIIAPARTGSRGSFLVLVIGCMLIHGLHRVIKKPLTTKKFAVICKRDLKKFWFFLKAVERGSGDFHLPQDGILHIRSLFS